MKIAVDLGCVRLGDVAELTRIPLTILGSFVWRGKRFKLNRATMSQFVENFRKRGGDVVIDYEHASAEPEVAKGGPVPAAGWLKEVEDGPDEKGVLWGLAEFTQRAREMIAAKEIKYISPEMGFAVRDKVSGEPQGATFLAIALTNRPFLDAMPAISLSESGWQIHKTEVAMKATRVTLAEGGEQAIVFCGEGEEEIQVEMDLGMAKLAPVPEVVRLSDIPEKEGRKDFTQIPADKLIAGEVFRAMQVGSELDRAIESGKILPAQRKHFETIAANDLDGFRDLVGSMKPQVDLSERGTALHAGFEGADLDKVDAKLGELTKALLSEKKDLTYGQAFKAVLRDNPKLSQERARLMKGPAVSEEE